MKYSRSEIRCQAHKIPELKFEQQSLTSFAGLVVFQQFFAQLEFKAQVRRCFREVTGGRIFGYATIFVQLVIHVLLGYRELRDSRFYRDDPLVNRRLGLNRLPDVCHRAGQNRPGMGTSNDGPSLIPPYHCPTRGAVGF